MTDTINYRSMADGEENEVYELVVRVFREHVAPVYSNQGAERFLHMISPEWLREKAAGENSFVIVAVQQDKLIGMVAIINDSHIALIFVDSSHRSNGIGRHLIGLAVNCCVECNHSLEAVTVSASPNSVSFYNKIGFKILSDEVDEDGMLFTPMRKPIG